MIDNANFAYRESEALTTDPVGLVVVLYDMLLRDLYTAVAAVRNGEIERRTQAVRHSLLVLQQLQGTLDFEKGGVVAENLDRFYNFSRSKLLEGQIKASSEIFEQQITFVTSIREAWQQVRQDQLRPAPAASVQTEAAVAGTLLAGEPQPAAQWSA